MRNPMKRALAFLLAALLTLGAASFAGAEDQAINVAITSTLSSMNPLLIDASEVVKHALSLTWLPLVELDREMDFVPQLAESITTEDNLHFTITLREDAKWSDGQPVTAEDVEFTFLLITSPEAGEAILSQYLLAGTDDAGKAEAGADSLEGVKVIDARTLTVETKDKVSLSTFNYNFGRYMFILPKHVLADVPRDELLTYGWFNKPDVISGPYFITDFDLNHYVHYVANENYFEGAPKTKYLNFNVVDAATIVAGLKAGEIDLVQQTMAAIPLEDYDAVKALAGVQAVPSTPITNQSIFFNVDNVPDKRIRQAVLYGMDREMILQELVHGNGELVDGFVVSASPVYTDIGLTPYDMEKARALVAEAAADGASTTLVWHAWSDDETMLNAVNYTAAMLAEIGLQIEVRTVDLSTLMDVAGGSDMQVMSVQYTYPPFDPYTDVDWLLSADGWTHYENEAVRAALLDSQASTDPAQIAADFAVVDRAMQEDVPMISAYVLSTLGAVSEKLPGVTPDVYGTFLGVQNWVKN